MDVIWLSIGWMVVVDLGYLAWNLLTVKGGGFGNIKFISRGSMNVDGEVLLMAVEELIP